MMIHFVLVEPAVPENVGAAARALKTMGFHSLRLVNPCEFREGKAQWLAHGSADILDKACVFPTLREAVADIDFVVATTAKRRSATGDLHLAEGIPEIIWQKKNSTDSVALVFGREESGLTNAEIQLCHISSYLPMAVAYPSLNLGQAVMLYAYLLSKINLAVEKPSVETATPSKFRTMNQQMANLLDDTRLSKNANITHRIFERMALLADGDINLVLSVLAAIKAKANFGIEH